MIQSIELAAVIVILILEAISLYMQRGDSKQQQEFRDEEIALLNDIANELQESNGEDSNLS